MTLYHIRNAWKQALRICFDCNLGIRYDVSSTQELSYYPAFVNCLYIHFRFFRHKVICYKPGEEIGRKVANGPASCMLDVTHVLEFVVNVSISALFLNAILSYRFTVVTDYSLRAAVKRSRPEVLPFFLTLGA